VTVVSDDGRDWLGRSGGPSRWGILFAAVWLVFLVYPLEEGWSARDSVHGWVSIAATLLFAGVYLASFGYVRRERLRRQHDWQPPQGPLLLVVMTALGLVVLLAIGQEGTATLVYLGVSGVLLVPARWAFAFSALLCVGNEVSSRTVDGWDRDSNLTFAVFAATFAMWGVRQMLARNLELITAREENARLVLVDERNRFARDLHDILGHSLTVITVKAELAQRLFDVDPERARAEVADLERLSRDALADVRRAVEGYRELSLPGELARARLALEAAEIEPRLPSSADDVPSSVRELFAWTIREGVTNVVRHSGARTCTVRLTPTSAEVADDGRGPVDAGSGNGLLGLRERAVAAGGSVVTTALDPGFSLKVVVP
jgi:two-component system sensor histidine kinase DesK